VELCRDELEENTISASSNELEQQEFGLRVLNNTIAALGSPTYGNFADLDDLVRQEALIFSERVYGERHSDQCTSQSLNCAC